MKLNKNIEPILLVLTVVILGFVFVFGAVEGSTKAILNHRTMTFTNGAGFVEVESEDSPGKYYIKATAPLRIEDATVDSILASGGVIPDSTSTQIKAFYKDVFAGMVFAFADAPSDATSWLICDGSRLDPALTTLNTVIGGAWGIEVIGGVTYNVLPDLRGRFVFGEFSTNVSDADNDAWRAAATNLITGNDNIGEHDHGVEGDPSSSTTSTDALNSGGHTHTAGGATGADFLYYDENNNYDEESTFYIIKSETWTAAFGLDPFKPDSDHTYGIIDSFGSVTTSTDSGDTDNDIGNLRHSHTLNAGTVSLLASQDGNNPEHQDETRPINASVYFYIFTGE